MKILFIQLRLESNMAVMTLSGFLKSMGHETEVLIVEGEKDYVSKISEKIRPDVIGYSTTTPDAKSLTAINNKLKKKLNFFSIFGGAHPTFFPEMIEEDPSVDAICVGEGEYALAELLDKLRDREPVEKISNLHIRKGNEVIKNPLRPLVDNLDSLPFLDKEIYAPYYHNRYLLENVPIRFLASRGCPYKCTYCFNHKFFDLYGIKGMAVRRRSVDSLIGEIKNIKSKFNIPMVSFVDDIFCISAGWIKEFAGKYEKEIALPYSINTRPNTINEEVVSALKRSGCYYVTFSIESGDEVLRNEVLRRNMNEADIVNAAGLLRKHGIQFATGNVLGVPGETLKTVRKTIGLNRKCAPHYAWASLFQPFPRLELTERAIKEGYFDGNFENIGNDQFTDSVLNLKQKRQIVRLHKFFALAVKYPYLEPLINLCLKLPFDNVYNWLFKKYKSRLNLPVVRASGETLAIQSREPFAAVVFYFLKDFLNEK